MLPIQNPYATSYLGEIRQAPDGQLYQLGEVVDGLGNRGLAWYPLSGSGLGEVASPPPQLGEIRRGADGLYYQYTVDGLGNVGFAPLLALASKALPFVASALPGIASAVGNLFKSSPSGSGQSQASGINIDELVSKLAALLGARGRSLSGLGDEPDLLGIGDDPDLMGLADDPDLPGIGDDPDLMGLSDDQDLMGYGQAGRGSFSEDPDLMGLADDLDLTGIGEDEDLRGLAEDDPTDMQGYFIPQADNLQGYVRGFPPSNPGYARRATQPDMWRPLWE